MRKEVSLVVSNMIYDGAPQSSHSSTDWYYIYIRLHLITIHNNRPNNEKRRHLNRHCGGIEHHTAFSSTK
jgi:hypothetical protein